MDAGSFNLLEPNLRVLEHDYPEVIAAYIDSPENSWRCDIHTFDEYKNKIKYYSLIGDKLYLDRDGWKALYLPTDAAKERFHDNFGHLGVDSALDLVRVDH